MIHIGYYRNELLLADRAEKNKGRQIFIAWAVALLRARKPENIDQTTLLAACSALPPQEKAHIYGFREGLFQVLWQNEAYNGGSPSACILATTERIRGGWASIFCAPPGSRAGDAQQCREDWIQYGGGSAADHWAEEASDRLSGRIHLSSQLRRRLLHRPGRCGCVSAAASAAQHRHRRSSRQRRRVVMFRRRSWCHSTRRSGSRRGRLQRRGRSSELVQNCWRTRWAGGKSGMCISTG
jgi:hypothetical protein